MSPLNPVADAIIAGRAFAEVMAHDHFDRFGSPATVMARAHTMRSVVQALVLNGSVVGFSLLDGYLAFGRVEVVHDDDQQHYLLKARNALPLQSSYQDSLFQHLGEGPVRGTQPLELLLYLFAGDELVLATVPAETLRIDGRLRIRMLGEVAEAGVWSSSTVPGLEPFDQGMGDDFGDLSGDVQILGENEE